MGIRSFVANHLPPAFARLQTAGVIPDPLQSPRVRRIGDRRHGDSYAEKVIGTYCAPVNRLKPKYDLNDGPALVYARLLEDWSASFSRVHRFGIYEIERAKIWPTYGVCLSEKCNLLDVYCNESSLRNPKYEIPRQFTSLIPSKQRHEAGIFIAVAWYHNFYHWLIDILPRLELTEEALSEGLPVFVPPNLNAQHRAALQAALRALGRDDSALVELGRGVHQIDRLIAPTRLSHPLDVSPRQRRFLRSCILSPYEGGRTRDERRSRRLYISRNDAAVRRIANEDDLLGALAPHGFERILLSTMPLRQQARLFDEAEVIIGHHGAGLANLAFCEPGTRVLEIFQDGHFAPCFARLAQIGELDYAFAVGRPAGGDTYADIGQIKYLLHELGL